MNDHDSLRSALRALLEESGETAVDLSRRIGKAPNWVGRILSGERDCPVAEFLILAEALGVSIALVRR